jgi:tetratricopeptide (TPR) repeat protein
LASSPGEREGHWHNAHAALTAALAHVAAHSRRPLLELQDTLLWLAEGELAKEEGLLATSGETLPIAREKLRTSIAMLEALADRVEEALRRERMTRTASSDEALTSEELTSLAQHIVLQTARALEAQAQTYPAESPDHINSLTRAVDQLTFLLSRAGDNKLRGEAELALARCKRLLGHVHDAERLLAAAGERRALPAGDIAAERVRLLLAAGRHTDALVVARQRREDSSNNSAELLLAHLEAIASQAASLTDPARQKQSMQEATQVLAAISERYGPRWQRRGELWVARLLAATNQTADTVATARLAAEGLYRAGRPAEAIAAFDRAAELAHEQSDAATAFDLAHTAAALVSQAGNEEEAAQRYLNLALGNPSHARAPEAHRLGILATAAAARTASSAEKRSALLVTYEQLLQSHLAQWPGAPSADEARIWLAKWRLQAGESAGERDEFAQVLAVLLEVTPQSEHFAASRRLLGEAYQERLARLEDAPGRSALANEAAHALQPVITGMNNQWPTKWTDLQRDLALILARIQLVHVQDGAVYADALLGAARASAPRDSDDWRQRAAGVQMAAKAVLGQTESAEPLLDELAGASAQVKTDVVLCLGEVLASASEPAQEVIGRFVLQILDGVQSAENPLDDATRLRLAHVGAQSLIATGRRAEAVAAYRDLVALAPGDAAMHEQYAALLAGNQSSDDRQEALRLYHEIEQRTKPGGPRWMRARLARITLLARLGEADHARKLLRLTRAVHPELGGADFGPQFEALATDLGE